MESDHQDQDQCLELACDPSNRRHEGDDRNDLRNEYNYTELLQNECPTVPLTSKFITVRV